MARPRPGPTPRRGWSVVSRARYFHHSWGLTRGGCSCAGGCVPCAADGGAVGGRSGHLRVVRKPAGGGAPGSAKRAGPAGAGPAYGQLMTDGRAYVRGIHCPQWDAVSAEVRNLPGGRVLRAGPGIQIEFPLDAAPPDFVVRRVAGPRRGGEARAGSAPCSPKAPPTAAWLVEPRSRGMETAEGAGEAVAGWPDANQPRRAGFRARRRSRGTPGRSSVDVVAVHALRVPDLRGAGSRIPGPRRGTKNGPSPTH